MTDRQRAPRYLYDPDTPLRVVEVRPTLVVVETEPYMFIDEPNPQSLTIYHPAGACMVAPEDGGCRPRLKARCRACGQAFNLCTATRSDFGALKLGTWHCGRCPMGVR